VPVVAALPCLIGQIARFPRRWSISRSQPLSVIFGRKLGPGVAPLILVIISVGQEGDAR